jgi:pyruvate-formate lyase-activating enzyme
MSLSDAVKKYPNADILIAVGREKYENVFEYLLSQGISFDKICFPRDVYYGIGCNYIGQTFVADNQITTCCFPNRETPCVTRTDSFLKDIRNYKTMCVELISNLQRGVKTVCEGCPKLVKGIFPLHPNISCLSPTTVENLDFCNCNCLYCYKNVQTRSSPEVDELRRQYMLDMIEYAASGKYPTHIDYAFGEISVASYCDEIINYALERHIEMQIFTNAVLYKESIDNLVRKTRSWIYCSIDAGTAETYARVKSIDCFDKVCDNLLKYSASGKIVLKYILLEGINDNIDDIIGFIKVVKSVNAEVVLSFDWTNAKSRMSAALLHTAKGFLDLCKESQIFVQHDHYDFYNIDDALEIYKYGKSICLFS